MMVSILFPLLLLTFALVNLLLYQRFNHDIYRVIAMGLAIICFVWGTAIAHWSIQLLGLFLLWRGDTLRLNLKWH